MPRLSLSASAARLVRQHWPTKLSNNLEESEWHATLRQPKKLRSLSLRVALASFARSIIFWATASRIGLTVASVRWSVTSLAKGKQQDAESQIDGSRGP
jgi:hypothetical protein